MAGHKLLLADDSITIQRVIGLTFASENVQVITVPDGEEAIARITQERPDIVLADIGMPKRSGYEVAAFVKSEPSLAHIPVVLLAGAFEPVDDARVRQAGSDGVLVKPFEPQHVIARVRELLEGVRSAAGSSPDIPRPVTRLAGPRPVEFHPRESTSDLAVTKDDFNFEAPAGVRNMAPVPAAEAAAAPVTADDTSLDDYFDRLDAAFADLDSAAPPQALEIEAAAKALPEETVAEGEIPTLDELLGEFGGRPARQPEPPRYAEREPDLDMLLDSVDPGALPAPSSQVAGSAFDGVAGLPDEPQREPLDIGSFDLDALDLPAPGVSAVDAAADLRPAFPAPPAFDFPAAQETAVPAAPAASGAMVDDIADRVLERLRAQTGSDLDTLVTRIVSEVAERLVREEIARIRGKVL